MLKKTITYTDYNGVERTEDYFFNLTEAELVEMQVSQAGGLTEMIKKIVAAKEEGIIMKIFQDLMLKAYGEKSDDGKMFRKIATDGHRLSDDFTQMPAYTIIFMELASDDKAAFNFIKGILPAKLAKQIEQEDIKA